MSIKGLQITKNQISYILPKQIKSISEFVQRNEIKRKLKQQFSQYANFLPNYPYRAETELKGSIFILYCRYCSNKLQYVFNIQKGIFQLTKFSFQHVHGINNYNQQIKTYNEIQQYTTKSLQIQEKIKEKFDKLSLSLSEYYKNRKQNKTDGSLSFQDLTKNLQQQKCFFSYQPQNYKEKQLAFPDYLLIISQEMKRSYCLFGRSVGIDFTYNLIKQTPLTKYSKSQYLIGFIAGLNSYRRINVFAILIVTQENGYFVQKAFTQFIKHMGKQPDSIVTDQSLGLLAGMKRLKQKGVFKGNSYWDTFHVLKTYKFRHRTLKTHIRKMIKTKCKYEFQKMYLQAVKMARTEDQMDAIHKFLHQSNKYCISQIQPNFIGLGVSDSQNQALNNLVKSKLNHQSKYTQIVQQLLVIIGQRNSLSQALIRDHCRVEQTLNMKQLRIVRHSLCRKVFNFLFGQIMNCYKVNLISLNQSQNDFDFYCLQNQDGVHFVDRNYVSNNKNLTKERQLHIKQQFKCTCKFKQKTGIPCQHILKIILEGDNNFIDRVDQYWVVQDPARLVPVVPNDNQEKLKQVRKRGRPSGRKALLFLKEPQGTQNRLPPQLSKIQTIKNRRSYETLYDNKQMQELLKNNIFMESQSQEDKQSQQDRQKQPTKVQSKQNDIKQRSDLIKNYYSTSKQ